MGNYSMGCSNRVITVPKAIRTAILWLVVIALAGEAAAFAQNIDLQQPLATAGSTMQMISPAEPTASQIIAFLRSHPQVMADIKQLAAERADALGHPIQPSAISDDLLYKRIEHHGLVSRDKQ